MARRDGAVYVIGGLILLAMANERNRIDWGIGWLWPIPDLMNPADATQLIPARISQEYRATGVPHRGVDLMWQQAGQWFAPEGIPVAAARPGRVWSVDRSPRGWEIVIDHGPPWATYYQHVAEVYPGIVKGATVDAGTLLGTMGVDPTDPQHVRHLHFAVWFKGSGDTASVDPAEAMVKWARWQWAPASGDVPPARAA